MPMVFSSQVSNDGLSVEAIRLKSNSGNRRATNRNSQHVPGLNSAEEQLIFVPQVFLDKRTISKLKVTVRKYTREARS